MGIYNIYILDAVMDFLLTKLGHVVAMRKILVSANFGFVSVSAWIRSTR